jgi:putative membrane protein
MKAFDRKNLCKKLAVFSGIAGISSLIAVPGIAELNPQPNGFKQSGDRVFELAQNTPTSPSSPNSPATTPNNNNNPGRSPNTPTTPSNNNNPGGSPNTPNTPSNNQNPGGSPNTPGGENSPSSLSSTDRNFILQAARSNMLEVELGRLAVQRGASDAVKQHGQQMVEEHSQANQELMQLAMQKGIELSPTEMSGQSTALRQQLSGLSGASFDAAYKQAMLASHNQAIALFQAQSRQGQDPDLKAWATKMLPNLQAHLQMVNRMAGNTRQQ